MTHNPDNRETSPETPADLIEVAGGLDRLAHAERQSADAGLESRLFAGSRDALGIHAGETLKFPRSANSRAWRLAASFALLVGGTAVAFWAASRQSPPPASSQRLASQSQDSPLDVETIRDELEDFLTAAESIDVGEIAASPEETGSFWGDDVPSFMEDSM